MNEAQARSTGKDCIYDPALDEWFTIEDAARPELAKAAQVSVKPTEPAKPLETKPTAKSTDAPAAPKKEGK